MKNDQKSLIAYILCQRGNHSIYSTPKGYLLVVIIFLFASHLAYAGIIIEDVVNSQDRQPDTYFWNGFPDWLTNYPIARYNGKDWGWTHSFILPDPDAGTIISATIAIEAYDVEVYERHIVNVGGVPIGTLIGDEEVMFTTILELPSTVFGDLSDGHTDIWINIGTQEGIDSVTIRSSTLRVEYGMPSLDEPEPIIPEPAIPEPSTLALLGLGMLIYRKRFIVKGLSP